MSDTENQRFVDFHAALMQLSHSKAFIGDTRERKLVSLAGLCSRLLNVDRVSIWQLNARADRIDTEVLVLREQTDRPVAQSLTLTSKDHSAYFDALKQARVIEVPQTQTDPRTRSFTRHYLQPLGICSLLDAPVFQAGELSGVVCLENCAERYWTLPEISFVAALADTISLLNTHEAWLHSKQKLDFITHYDNLTGLANLQSLRDRIDHLIDRIDLRGMGNFALLWLDLDRIKAINDGLGPQAGDEVISQTGFRLQEMSLSGKDQLARIGGDEFALILRNQTDPDAMEDAMERILENLSQPLQIHGQPVSVSASIGLSYYPGNGYDSESLLRSSEAAMYHAKTLGRSQAYEFDDSIQNTARSRFALEREIRTAIRQEQLDVFYQPLVDAATGDLAGAEALVRWNHPERGWLTPIEFLDLARSAGLMPALGACVLKRVCTDMAFADSKDRKMPDVSVNLAAEQVLDPGLPDQVNRICAEAGIRRNRIHFEVTEDSIQGDSRAIQETLEKLVKDGSRLAIDDFGTGYSSLSRLKHLPFSGLKIDRSFVYDLPHNADDCAITLSIIGLARGLGLSIIAEGVETGAHERWLQQQGCQYLQGYRYARPLPLATFAGEFLNNTQLRAGQKRS